MKALIKRLVSHYSPEASDSARVQTLLASHQVDVVLDVGANKGQFGTKLRNGGFRGHIISFEPLSQAHDSLMRRAAADEQWTVAPRMAIGHVDGEAEINIAGNSASSSIAPMEEAHLDVAPQSAYVGTEKTRLARLDTVARDWIRGSDRVYLKIDTQGYEERVLEGAKGILPHVVGVQVELSLVPLYSGCPLFAEMIAKLGDIGFAVHALLPGLTDPDSGRLLQVDGIFFR